MSQVIDATHVNSIGFALALYRRLVDGDDPLLISPVSVSLVLGALAAGARGTTAEGIRGALSGGAASTSNRPKPDQFLAADGEILSLAIGLWLDRAFVVDPAFAAMMRAERRVEMAELEFATPEAARATINRWTEERTNRRIQDLIQPGMITGDTQLLATSAVHFQDAWDRPFEIGLTRPTPFTRSDGSRGEVAMMRDVRSAVLALERDASLLELAYQGGCCLHVLLPDSPSGLEAMEARLTPATLDGWLDRAERREVDLWLPRFESASRVSLRDPLSALGMRDAFDPERADFSGIGRAPDGRRLILAEAVHQTFVDVNELETEAAAATAAVMVRSMGLRRPPRRVEFHADHPFLYMIRNGRKGSIIFMGRMTGR
jgi:serpin B